jgi:hypothetical protein
MSLSARVSVLRAVSKSSSTSIGPYKSSKPATLQYGHTKGTQVEALFTERRAIGPNLYLLGRIYSILGIRPHHTGLSGQAFVRLVRTTSHGKKEPGSIEG